MLKFKSVYDPIEKGTDCASWQHGVRGHGMKMDRYDMWMPSLGPSEKLLKDKLGDAVSWKDFSKKYKDEVLSSTAIDKKNRTILNHGQKFTLRLIKKLAGKQNVTLMCHCDTNEEQCHLRVLEKIIMKV